MTPCGRSPIACGRARSTNSSARTRCSGRASRCARRSRTASCTRSSCGGRRAPARRRWRGSSRAARDAEFMQLSAVMAGVKDIREAVERARDRARRARPPQRAVPRRSASLQQGAAGHFPAVCRGRHAHLHRRDHRESLVRGHQRVAVARARLRAAFAGRRRHRQTTAPRARGRERGLGSARAAHRRRRR